MSQKGVSRAEPPDYSVASCHVILPAGHRFHVMTKLISRVLALAVAAIVAGAVFVTAAAIWSWWAPAGPVASDVQSPAVPAPPDRIESTPLPR